MGKFVDLTGQKIGKLTVVKRVENDKHGNAMWLCKCECGKEKIILGNTLRSTNIKSCGCVITPKDLTGQRFGKLTVLGLDDIRNKKEKERKNNGEIKQAVIFWLCKCDCGNEKSIRGSSLGKTQSCGCLHKEKLIGENNPKYNPNLTDEEREIGRNIDGYGDFIKTVLKRDRYTCQCCGLKNNNMEVHHLDGYNWCKDKRTDISNGITLCDKCHDVFHRKYGGQDNTKEQFEDFLSKHIGKTLDGTTINKECEEIVSYDVLIDSYPKKRFQTSKQVYNFLKEIGVEIGCVRTLRRYISGTSPMPKHLYNLGLHRADKKMEDYKVQIEKYKPKKVICDGKLFETITDCAIKYDEVFITMSQWLRGISSMPQKYIDLGLRYATEEDALTYDSKN